MRRRFRRRLSTAIFVAIICGGFFAVIDWMGYTGWYWRTRGIIQYHTVGEALRAFAFIGVLMFVVLMLWPFRDAGDWP